MVFLIQNSQNRNSAAIQVKLDELIRVGTAQNLLVGIEHLTDKELEDLRKTCESRAKAGKTELRPAILNQYSKSKRKTSRRSCSITTRFMRSGSSSGRRTFSSSSPSPVGLWIWINIGESKWRFDEYPFALLALIFALEAVLLTSCVLIRQNISDQAFERRNHLDLQINLLAERESTLSLDILRRLAAHMKCPIDLDAQCEELTKETPVDAIAQDLRACEEKEEEEKAT